MFPTHFIYKSELGSTNEYAASLLKTPLPPEGTVVFTPHQTEGRGQRGTVWETQAAQNLAFSLILYPHFLPFSHFFYLSKIAALAVHAAVQVLLPQKKVQIKWANDILVEKQKIAGILIENQFEGNQLKGIIIGIGLNVNQTTFEMKMNTPPTSLHLQSGSTYVVTEVLQEICTHFHTFYKLLQQQDYEKIDKLYLSQLLGYKEWVSLLVNEETQHAYIEEVMKNGELKTLINGVYHTFDIKEIKWIL
ncbi:MAG: biotin--[acetyl-CoA-carboxylase] ligase [Bacteroidia bacterium]